MESYCGDPLSRRLLKHQYVNVKASQCLGFGGLGWVAKGSGFRACFFEV